MSTFPKHDLLGDLPEPEPREPVYDRLTVPPLSEQQVEYCAWCDGSGVERPGTVEARPCRHCGGDGLA